MKQRIENNWSSKKLDSFLKERYGYGIWSFEFTLFETYISYNPKHIKKVFKSIGEKIERLEKTKTRMIELLDYFLITMNFPKLYNKLPFTKKAKWIPQKRKDFIIKHYKLNDCFLIIDKQIDFYKKGIYGIYEKYKSKPHTDLYLKPINFVVLIWSYAMRKGKKVDWINMENLLNWFSIKLDEIDILDFYGLEKEAAPPTEILRFIRNRYRNTENDAIARFLFNGYFDFMKDKIIKDKSMEAAPHPLDILALSVKSLTRNVKILVEWNDSKMLANWIKGFDRKKEYFFSLDSYDPKD